MGKYGTYLEFNRSQEAPKHCPTFDSLIQCCAIAHFRLPPVCPRFAPSLPPVWLPLHFCHWFLSDGESIFLSTCFLEGKSDEKRGDGSWGGKVKFENKQGAWGGLGRWVAGRGGEWVVIVQIDSDFCSCQCRIWGKTTLHPFVGWMWDIGNTMWDDPTSFQFHFRFYIWNIKTKIVERQQLHRCNAIHLPRQPPYAWFWHIKISVPKSKSKIHFLQKSHIHPTFTEGNPVSINVILKVFTFLEVPHASHIMSKEHPTCIPHIWYTPNRQTVSVIWGSMH